MAHHLSERRRSFVEWKRTSQLSGWSFQNSRRRPRGGLEENAMFKTIGFRCALWTDTRVDSWKGFSQVSQNDSVIGNYTYDGLSRRNTRTAGGVMLHTYYSDAWRPLEERIDTQTTPSAQYLWGARHRDDLVRRDRATTSGGSLDETRYVLMDYFSPAAIADQTGAVTERYAFSAFGIRTILAPNFNPITSSECAWTFAFQGQFPDSESAFLDYGYRYYATF